MWHALYSNIVPKKAEFFWIYRKKWGIFKQKRERCAESAVLSRWYFDKILNNGVDRHWEVVLS